MELKLSMRPEMSKCRQNTGNDTGLMPSVYSRPTCGGWTKQEEMKESTNLSSRNVRIRYALSSSDLIADHCNL